MKKGEGKEDMIKYDGVERESEERMSERETERTRARIKIMEK